MYKNGDQMANDRFFIVKSVLMISWSKCCGMMESASCRLLGALQLFFNVCSVLLSYPVSLLLLKPTVAF